MRAARRSCWAAILADGWAWLVAPRPHLATLDRLLGLLHQRLTLMHEASAHLTVLRNDAAMGQDGHASMASAETSRNSFSVAPPAA